MSSQLAAVVLCGGFSTRMGRDKGSIPAGGSIWAVQAAAKAILLNLDVYYSVREEQIPLYLPYIDTNRFIVDNSPLDGPLKGLASAHQLLPEQDIFLLACDMPALPCDTAYTLIREYISCGNDFFAFYDNGFYQPFCAVYTAAGLKQVWQQRPSSLQDVLRRGNTLQVLPPDANAFQHRNEPDLL